MVNRLVVACAVACSAASANAAWGLKFEVSNDDGVPWRSSLLASAGDTIKFRVGAYFDAGRMITTVDGTGQALWLNRFTGSNQWTGINGDSISGLAMNMSSGNPQLLTVSGGTVGTTSPLSFGANLASSNLPESPIYYSEIYSGFIKIANTPVRGLVWGSKTFGTASVNGLTFYNAGSPTNKLPGTPDGVSTHLDAFIFVPAPSTLAMVGLGSLAAVRRRRSC